LMGHCCCKTAFQRSWQLPEGVIPFARLTRIHPATVSCPPLASPWRLSLLWCGMAAARRLPHDCRVIELPPPMPPQNLCLVHAAAKTVPPQAMHIQVPGRTELKEAHDSCCEAYFDRESCNAGWHGHGKGPCSHQWGRANGPLLQSSHHLRWGLATPRHKTVPICLLAVPAIVLLKVSVWAALERT
jgi:hypothetical protein